MNNILAIFTCFNRKDKTENCIKSLAKKNSDCKFTFVVVDDNSADGTREMLIGLRDTYDINLIRGGGNLFYSGGMRTGMEYALNELKPDFDYLLMCNDDVDFYDGCIEKMIKQSGEQAGAVVVGATRKSSGEQSYGAVKYTKGIKYRRLSIEEWNIEADTFNANCVLVPYEAFRKVGAIDNHYIHSLGDFDYGLSLKRAGYKIYSSKKYAGACENNPSKGGWTDSSLSRAERIKKKESPKGAPTKPWFWFLKKNFGILTAVKGTVTPYIRILLGK